MKRADFRFFHRMRVRWVEVDMQKIVFNGHYLMYFDTAIADYWRSLALPYEESMHQLGGDLYVKKATLEYFASARYDDRLDVALRCAKIGNSSMLFEGAIFHGEKLLIGGELLYVYADPATQTSRRVPDTLRDMLEGYERGDAMTRIQVGTWQALERDAAAVRTEVFVEEQGIAREDEWDEAEGAGMPVVCAAQRSGSAAVGCTTPSGAIRC